MARLIVVSNRVALPTRDAQAGGLAVAMRAVLKRHAGVWFGWSGRVAAKEIRSSLTLEQAGVSYIVTDLTREDYDEYYNGFANRVLWPILHYRLDLAEFSRRDLSGYMRVNEHFASELHKFIRPDDVVWVHDYHLMPLAKMLRERGHRNRIGFFLHIPFPPTEMLTALPNHERLIGTMVHYDLVGFQTKNDAGNFARYLEHECRAIKINPHTFDAADRRVRVEAFPISIETAEFNRLARRAVHLPFVKNVLESLSGHIMMIGVDRLDYSKGLPLRMEAFERFLQAHPDWAGLVTYLQIMLSDVTEIWQLYFGLMFIAVVMFAPGGLAGLLMMHVPLMRARVLHLLMLPYALLLAAASIAGVGAIVIVELTHRLTVKGTEGTVMRLFGISLDTESAWPWLVAAALAAGGGLLARATWPLATRALSDATAAAHTGERS